MKLSVHCIEPHTAARAARPIRRPIQVGSPPTCRPPPRCVQHHVLAAHSRAAHAHSLARPTRAGCNPVRHTPTRHADAAAREWSCGRDHAGGNELAVAQLRSTQGRGCAHHSSSAREAARAGIDALGTRLALPKHVGALRRPRQQRRRRDDARRRPPTQPPRLGVGRPHSQRCQVSPPLGPPLSDVQCRCQKWQARARGWLSCPRERRTRTWRLPSRKCPRSCSIVARMPPTRMSAFARPWMCDGLPSHHTFCAARSISATLATSSTTAGGSMVNRGSSVDWRGRSYKTRKFGK